MCTWTKKAPYHVWHDNNNNNDNGVCTMYRLCTRFNAIFM